jgi:hypothetical protein
MGRATRIKGGVHVSSCGRVHALESTQCMLEKCFDATHTNSSKSKLTRRVDSRHSNSPGWYQYWSNRDRKDWLRVEAWVLEREYTTVHPRARLWAD